MNLRNLPPLGKTTAPRPKHPNTRKYNPSLALQQTKEGKAYLAPIRKLEPYDRLIYWITERHRIHETRFPHGISAALGEEYRGTPWGTAEDLEGGIVTLPPWTDDPILQTVFFCNPYRENDKVTAYFRDYFRQEFKDKPCTFLGMILLRLFNCIPTASRLIAENIPQRMDATKPKQCYKALEDTLKLLVPLRDEGHQMFGGAYIIKFFNGMRKVEAGIEIMKTLVKADFMYDELRGAKRVKLDHKKQISGLAVPHEIGSMAYANARLTSFYGMGPFYVYQFIGDLAYTHVLSEAADWKTWSFCGPGTSRGLLRLRGITTKANGDVMERRIDKPKGWEEQLLKLQAQVNKSLKKERMPEMHMRDLTNCLCEFDKYERALNNERNLKRPYAGRGI